MELLIPRPSKHDELLSPESSGSTEDVTMIGFSGPVA
jgi:hypothetical protein